MILTRKRRFWRRRFALLPIVINDGREQTVIWLEWVWVRPDPYFGNEVSLTNPEVKVVA